MSDEKLIKRPSKLYCCVSNCSAHNRTIDPRNQKQVKLHSFPDPLKEKKRCLKWIINLRREDLNLTNIKHKKVCSQHFEPEAYNCPDNISESRLRPSAIPTIVQCGDPPKLTVTGDRWKNLKRKLSTILPDIIDECKEERERQNIDRINSALETEVFLLKNEIATLKDKLKKSRSLAYQLKRKVIRLEHKNFVYKKFKQNIFSNLNDERKTTEKPIQSSPPVPVNLFKIIIEEKKIQLC